MLRSSITFSQRSIPDFQPAVQLLNIDLEDLMRVDNRPAQPSVAASTRTWKTPSGNVYTEPAPNAPLARGHGGDRVSDLQRRLNAAGFKPPLEVDGLLGPKTEAALQKLTGSKTFDAAAEATLARLQEAAPKSDGFEVGTKAPTLPEAPAVEVPSAVGRPPPSGSVAEKTLAIARGEVGTVDPRKVGADGRYEGWQKLQTIFEKTTGWRPSDKEIQASSQPQNKSWCGIFAAHVLQEAGVNVKWDLTKGKMTGDVDHVLQPAFKDWRTAKAERQAFESSIRPGDVITLSGKLNHHAIVTSVNPDGTVNTIDGNKPHIGEGKHKLSDVTSYYRPRDNKAPEPVPTPAGASNVEGGQSSPSTNKSISTQFHVATPTPPSAEAMKEPVDLSGDKAARMKALSTFTQLDSKVSEDSDTNACAAASVVAGAAIEGGNEGIKKLIQVIEDRGNKTVERRADGRGWKEGMYIEGWDKLPGIKDRAARGTLTKQDLADLKTIVYRQLRQVEKDIGATSTNSTIDVDAVRNYLNTDVKFFGVDRPLKAMFDNMNVKLVDIDGNGTADHFVLMFNDGTGKGENAVYDPWPTRSGNQINRNQADLLWYHHAVKNAVR
ncbi:MAG: peptidoglycan-binding protein [Myxococcota bacterium]